MSCCQGRRGVRKLGVLVLVGALVCAAAMRGKRRPQEPRPSMWDKMRQHMEEMPEDFPPRVMFDNVAATRETTERILEILQDRGGAAEETADTDADEADG